MENNNSEQKEKAYAQWVTFNLQPSNFELSVRGATLDWGKFYYPANDKDQEITADEVNKLKIQQKDTLVFGSCGRSDAASGTTGSFELWDNEKGTYIGTFIWNCPWGSKTNSCRFEASSKNYIVEYTGANLNSGALGNIVFRAVYIGEDK